MIEMFLALLVIWFLDKEYPRFFKWILSPLACFLLLAGVGGCIYDVWWTSAHPVETIDCSAADIRCINTDGSPP